MTKDELSSSEVAERIGVSMSTLKNWAVRLPVPSVLDHDGSRRFPPEALAVLEAVKRLREEERSYATIRRAIVEGETHPQANADISSSDGPDLGLPDELSVSVEPDLTSDALNLNLVSAADHPEHSELVDSEGLMPHEASNRSPEGEIELTVTMAPPEPVSQMPEATLALVAQVLQIVRDESALVESYAASRQRVGELEMQVKLMQAEQQRLLAELADARALLLPQVSATARKPWYQRLKTYLFP